MGQKNRAVILFVFFLISFGTARAFAEAEPSWRFQVLRSDHFEIIYRDTQKALAKRYILAAEQARELLLPIFKEAPDLVQIYLSDDTDMANGMATFLPYPMITVYPVLPAPIESISDYGDWPLEIMVHEYTHILNMYPAHGIYAPLKYIFGSVMRPNAVLPKWYLEGLAVNMESHLTDHGRLRADETAADARALEVGGLRRAETLPTINEQDLTSWPYGTRPYMFGGWWWNSVQAEHGQEIIGTWNQNFARRLPFFLNGPLREATGMSASELLAHAQEKQGEQAAKELEQIHAHPSPPSRPLAESEHGNQVTFALSPDSSKLIYFTKRPNYGLRAMLKTRTGSADFATIEPQRLFHAASVTQVRWIDNDRFVFDDIDIISPYTTYSDLYMYNLKTSERTRLTHQARAAQPAVAPDSEHIAFILNDGGRNSLALMPLKIDAQPKILVRGSDQQRLSGPEFLSETEILFVMRNRPGLERLYVYNLKTKRAVPWSTKLSHTQVPRKTAKGILVSDDHTHVRNLYLVASRDAEPIAVTNSETHITYSDYDPKRDELLYSELTGTGPILRAQKFTETHPPELKTMDLGAPPQTTIKSVRVKEESYQPFSYLYPRYFVPFVYTVENNGLLFQATTSNADPAGRNEYSAVASIDTITQLPSYGLTYTNHSLDVDLGGSYGKSVSWLGANNYTLQSESEELDVSGFWPFESRRTKWNIGLLNTSIQAPSLSYKRAGPTFSLQYNRLDSPTNRVNGYVVEVGQQQYLPLGGGDLAYGRTYLHAADVLQFGGGHKLFIQARAAFAPDLPMTDALDLGDRNLGANYLVNIPNSDFLLRGYSSGTFVGRKIINANLEYSLPLFQVSSGYGTLPVFLRALEVVLLYDTMSVEGGAYTPAVNNYTSASLDEFSSGVGAELRLSTTAGYQLPVSFILGAYYGLNQQFGGGFMPFLGFGLGGLSALRDKTP